MPRTAQEEQIFLKYFFSTYIPPFSRSIPRDEDTFKDVFLSATDVWDNFSHALDSYSFSERLKTVLKRFFKLCDSLWEGYLCIKDDEFNNWVSSPPVQKSRSAVQKQAKYISNLAENTIF